MADQIVVITDTSVLINFLVIDQVRLMTSIPGRQFMVTDHVRSEVTEHFPEQLIRLEHALTIGILVEIVVADIAEVQAFARLTATGLGVGECSAIAVASCRGHAIALDDKLARKRIANLYPTLAVSIATKNQPFSQGGWKGVAELVVGFERKLGCLFLSIVPTRLPIFHEGSCDTIARSSARFHGCRS